MRTGGLEDRRKGGPDDGRTGGSEVRRIEETAASRFTSVSLCERAGAARDLLEETMTATSPGAGVTFVEDPR